MRFDKITFIQPTIAVGVFFSRAIGCVKIPFFNAAETARLQ